jgi:hypothetical protein
VRGLHPLPLLLQIFFAAETQIRLVFMEQALGVLAVQVQTVRLPIGNVGAADVTALVPIEAQPFQVGDELTFVPGLAAFDVGVLDAKHHDPALLPGKQPVE